MGNHATREIHGEYDEEGGEFFQFVSLFGKSVSSHYRTQQTRQGSHRCIQERVDIPRADVGILEDRSVADGGKTKWFVKRSGVGKQLHGITYGSKKGIEDGIEEDQAQKTQKDIVDHIEGDIAGCVFLFHRFRLTTNSVRSFS